MTLNDKFRVIVPSFVFSSLTVLLVFAYFIQEDYPKWLFWLILILTNTVVVLVIYLKQKNKITHHEKATIWKIYEIITNKGYSATTLLAWTQIVMILFLFFFSFTDFSVNGEIQEWDFYDRMLHVDIYWIILNFFISSDNSIVPIGFGKVLTVFVNAIGMFFWGMYISVIINRLNIEVNKDCSTKKEEETHSQT